MHTIQSNNRYFHELATVQKTYTSRDILLWDCLALLKYATLGEFSGYTMKKNKTCENTNTLE